MARQEHVLSVFVASPSDVSDERSKLEEVIRELNLLWSKTLGVRLELIRWETNAYPDFGDDAQDVINHQIEDDFDIFVGILWCRYGTPTKRFDSGTEEEFRRAKDRFDKSPKSVGIMVYFKDAVMHPSQIDLQQLSAVRKFKASLGEEGALYWNYKEFGEFEKLIRMHLTRRVQDWIKDQGRVENDNKLSVIPSKSFPPDSRHNAAQSDPADDDLGLLDLAEIFEESFAAVTEIAQRIASATEEVGQRMTERATEMNEVKARSEGGVNRADAKRLITKAALDFDQYASRIEAELPLFGDHLEKGMNALIRTAEISSVPAQDSESQNDITGAVQAISSFHNIVEGVEVQIAQFQTVVASVPRMTTVLNRSKRRVVLVLTDFLEQLQKARKLAREAQITIQRLVIEPD